MKIKKTTPILLILSSLLLSSCTFFIPPSVNPSSEPTSEPSSSSSSSFVRELESIKVADLNETYIIGDVYNEKCDLNFAYYYNDGTIEYEKSDDITVTAIRFKDRVGNVSPNEPFASGAVYEVFVSYILDGNTRTAKFEIDVLNGIESGLELVSFEIDELLYIIGKPFQEMINNSTFIATWEGDIKESYLYSENKNVIKASLYKDNGTVNVINDPIEQSSLYSFEAYIDGFEEIKFETTFETAESKGYYTLEKGEIIYENLSKVSPHEGAAKMLVIPIELQAETSSNIGTVWNDEKIEYLDNLFFGEKEDTPNEWNSMRTYYDTASGGMVQIEGEISSVYRPSASAYTIESCSESYNTLHHMFNDAIEFVRKTDTNMDWTQYDRNNDGFIDNLHFITNPTTITTNDSCLWPHKYEIYSNYNNPGTQEAPVGYLYETTTYGHLSDSRTIVHEQGHMFGIPDYYDYSYSGVDYVGCYDMQSHNVMDWNSWSKFSVGWGNAIVVDGTLDTTVISLKSASLYNQCLIIPANIETFNNSAFDEFFLLELFTNDGNNAYDFKRFFPAAKMDAGIRLYHVDARLYSSYYRDEVETIEEIEKSLKYRAGSVDVGVNNSFYYYDYAVPGNPNWADFKHLALIQKEGENTFGKASDSPTKMRLNDLFIAGDTFTFDKYAHFLSKTNQEITTMDNGEVFPYQIDIISVNKDEAIIKVSKIDL